MSHPREPWYDDESGPLVRLYAVTRGRARPARPELSMNSLVVDIGRGTILRRTDPEYAAIVRLCAVPQSVAEVSAHLHLPLTLTKILVGDLIEDGRLAVRSAVQASHGNADLDILRAIAHNLRGD
ncbi:DUF742 domain-containing protein [Nocardia paucivorans]|uniref:DUF742 domain-containing protein n=1 Tax=Nocardia paucivorans TaxID=114259 RepID=UPI0002E76FF7|nr:DUF742 domain-containing protein [Nocardia paucivorans]